MTSELTLPASLVGVFSDFSPKMTTNYFYHFTNFCIIEQIYLIVSQYRFVPHPSKDDNRAHPDISVSFK